MFFWWERHTWRFTSVEHKGLEEAVPRLLGMQTGDSAPDKARDVAMSMSDQGSYNNVLCWMKNWTRYWACGIFMGNERTCAWLCGSDRQQRYIAKLFTGWWAMNRAPLIPHTYQSRGAAFWHIQVGTSTAITTFGLDSVNCEPAETQAVTCLHRKKHINTGNRSSCVTRLKWVPFQMSPSLVRKCGFIICKHMAWSKAPGHDSNHLVRWASNFSCHHSCWSN